MAAKTAKNSTERELRSDFSALIAVSRFGVKSISKESVMGSFVMDKGIGCVKKKRE